MKFRKAGIFTKLVVLIVGIWAAVSLVGLNSRIDSAEARKAELEALAAKKAEENAALESIIASKDDPETIKDVARQRLGLVMPGEIIFYDIGG